MAEPTPIQCHVIQITGGLWLNGIGDLDDAESIGNYFREQGLPVNIDADGILLMDLTMEHFFRLAGEANIELV